MEGRAVTGEVLVEVLERWFGPRSGYVRRTSKPHVDKTRDARNFARYLDETLERWGDQAEVHYGPHSWPIWGNDEHSEVSSRTSATCTSTSTTRRYGWPTRATPRWRQPRSSSCRPSSPTSGTTASTTAPSTTTCAACSPKNWACGTATRCPYPHVPVETARRYVDLIGADKILAEGRRAFDEGDYRWAAQVLHNLVFAHPENQDAKNLQADAYEQMGYQTEAPQWRGNSSPPPANSEKASWKHIQHSLAPTPSQPCRWTSCSTSPASTSSATRPSTPTCGSTSPSPTSTRPGPSG